MANGKQPMRSTMDTTTSISNRGVPKNAATNMVKQMPIQRAKESAKTRRLLSEALKREFIIYLKDGIIKKARQHDGRMKKGKQGKDIH